MQHMNPRELFQVAEFYNNSGAKAITRARYLIMRELLEPQKMFEIADNCDLGVVYREASEDQDTPTSYWAFWFTGHKFEEEVNMSFSLHCTTPHQALDCVVEQMKIDSEGEQHEAVESNQ